MTRTVISGGQVLTLDPEGSYFGVGTVVIAGDRITYVGPETELLPDDHVVDATGMAVLPGLIDLHFHSALAKGYNDHLPLWEYLDECWYPFIRALDAEAAYWAGMASYAEALKCGVTTVNDMYRQLGSLARAVETIGIRAVLSNDTALDTFDLDTLSDNRASYEVAHGRAAGRIEVRVGIEWLPLASPQFLRDARALANELGIGIHIHLNESESEVADAMARFNRRPIELAYETGLLGPDVVAAHCVHLTPAEIGMLAETGTFVSHNPSSNAKLGNGISPVPELLAAGVVVGLGHDAVECNNSGDMFEVMKYASLMHRASRKDAALMPADQVLRMATNAGARALGHDTGQLAVGAKADVVLVDVQNLMFTPMLTESAEHLKSHLVFAANGSAVHTVIVDGRIVVSNHALVYADEAEIIREANAAFRRIRSSIGPIQFRAK